MKLTKSFVREFEKQQKQYGTKVALFNVIWSMTADMLKEIGVKSVKTK